MSLLALLCAVLALFCCVYLYVELQKKLSPTDIEKKLLSYSEELKLTYGRSVKEIETEWADMYQKFMRIAGRVDKVRGLEGNQVQQIAAPETYRTGTRSDLLRKRRGGTS